MNSDNFNLRVEFEEYTVKKGDSMYTIAKKYGTTVSELTDINMLTSTVIYPGQVLLVPKKQNVATDYYFDTYTIKSGDTIEKIATKFNIDPVTIGLYNDFGKLQIAPEQTLKIPLSNVYVVKNGDTVDTILDITGRTADQLLRSNSSMWLQTGTKIYL